jgi:hypothetical protein
MGNRLLADKKIDQHSSDRSGKARKMYYWQFDFPFTQLI